MQDPLLDVVNGKNDLGAGVVSPGTAETATS